MSELVVVIVPPATTVTVLLAELATPPIHSPPADTLPLEVAIAAKLVTLAYAGFLAYLAFAPRRMAARG